MSNCLNAGAQEASRSDGAPPPSQPRPSQVAAQKLGGLATSVISRLITTLRLMYQVSISKLFISRQRKPPDLPKRKEKRLVWLCRQLASWQAVAANM